MAVRETLPAEECGGCKSGNLYEKDLEKGIMMAWNGIVEDRENFLPA